MVVFPRGAVAIGNGDLVQAVNIKIDQKLAGTKLIHTVRKQGAGVVLGNEETNVSFEFVVPEGGAERDYYAMMRRRKPLKLRVKVPGETFSVDGVIHGRGLELPSDDAIKGTVEFMGNSEV